MKKISKPIAIKTSRKLALETSTVKLLSGEQLATAQGGASGMACHTNYCTSF